MKACQRLELSESLWCLLGLVGLQCCHQPHPAAVLCLLAQSVELMEVCFAHQLSVEFQTAEEMIPSCQLRL